MRLPDTRRLPRADLLKVLPLALITPPLVPPAWSSTAVTADPILAELSRRIRDEAPTQQQASLGETLGTPFGAKTDNLVFPPWLAGEWKITSNILGVAAPLGRRFLPTDLARVRLGTITPEDGVPPLQYDVRFFQRASDGVIIAAARR